MQYAQTNDPTAHAKMLNTLNLAKETIDKNPQALINSDPNATTNIQNLISGNFLSTPPPPSAPLAPKPRPPTNIPI